MALRVLILDVDGVMTTGQFFYSKSGKELKVFGPDDADGLALVQNHLSIQFVSADHRGFPISKCRIVDDMKYPLDLVPNHERLQWIADRYPLKEVAYMGDGIFDHYILREVGYALAPANAHPHCKAVANYVTQASGGAGAVAEACLHLLSKFFIPYDPKQPLESTL